MLKLNEIILRSEVEKSVSKMLSHACVENLTTMNMLEDCMDYNYKIEATRRRKLQEFLKCQRKEEDLCPKEGVMNYLLRYSHILKQKSHR